jgi:hypothetical protein
MNFIDFLLENKNYEYFYFENGFPIDIKDKILKNSHRLEKKIGLPRCHFEVARWYNFLVNELNIDKNIIKIVRGYYDSSNSFYDTRPEHYWLKINNKIFDPTAWQFGLKVFTKKYTSLGIKKNPIEWANKNCEYNH